MRPAFASQHDDGLTAGAFYEASLPEQLVTS